MRQMSHVPCQVLHDHCHINRLPPANSPTISKRPQNPEFSFETKNHLKGRRKKTCYSLPILEVAL